MYIFGLLLYIAIPSLVFVVPAANALVTQCFTLSPEITILITFAYFYPLSVFVYSLIRKQKDVAYLAYFSSQVRLASSLAVSFGLIGTFIGLSEMIAGIAAGMGADGDFSEKMASLLSSIGLALDSMSFAFLTSILGVSCSVSVLIASNYLSHYFEREHVQGENSATGGAQNSIDGISQEQQQTINDNFQQVQQSIQTTLNLINDKDKVWTDLFTLLENNSGSTVVQQFSASLDENNRLAQQQSNQVQQIYSEQSSMYQRMDTSLTDYSQYMQQQTQAMVGAINTMSSEVDRMTNIIDQTANQTNQAIAENGDVIEKVNASFSDALASTNTQLKDVAEILHDIRVATAIPLEESLHNALRDNDFHLVFQPQFNEDQTVVGAESYIRWIEPVRGMIPNGKLFQAAKKEGLSVQLEFWVMRNTIKKVSEWQKKQMWEHSWTVSINATSELLLAADFITEVEKSMNQYEVLPGSIAFEVTEDVIMQYDAQAKDKIRQLHNMGMKLYIDNFGTGYTNIAHLSEFHPERLKLARDVVNNITDDSQSGVAVVRSVMSIAQQLGITVSADGVETQEQYELLKAEGCNLYQGWFFEKPLDSEAFESRLNSERADNVAENLHKEAEKGIENSTIEDAEIVDETGLSLIHI